MSEETLWCLLVGLLPVTPVLGLVALVLPMLVGRPLPERSVNLLTRLFAGFHLLVAAAIAGMVVSRGAVSVDLGQWYGDAEYALELFFWIDGTSAAAALTSAALGVFILRFCESFLHQERGHLRFFATSLLALACLDVVALAGTLDVLFAGWELLGLCSFLLIAFFHEREETVQRGLRAAFSYRIADLGLLFALILLHAADMDTGLAGMAQGTGPLAATVGPLLLITAAGKAGLGPFSGWLGRSMEGPTPSTAMFYAGLSVSAGPYLLLRSWPLYGHSLLARMILVVFGLLAAWSASNQARTRSDVKGAVVLAGAGQLGLIVAEIGLGFHLLACLHLLSNLGLRVWQVMQAGNALHLAHRREGLLGRPLPAPHPIPVGRWLWRSEGWFEPVVQKAVRAVLRVSGWIDRLSRIAEKLAVGGRDEDPE